MTITGFLPLLTGIAVLVVVTIIALRLAEVGLGWLPVVAIVRAIVQLSFVALPLSGSLTAWWAIACFIGLMLITASGLRGSWGEVEARLSLRAQPRRAAKRLRRTATREALLPNLDQTKNTGLVTLPAGSGS